MADAQIGQVKIHYTEAGAGDPLLLIMGFGMPGVPCHLLRQSWHRSQRHA
jgi:pimeloyl-ACP methyl ester carboxylesterase